MTRGEDMRQFDQLIEESSLGTKNAKRRRRQTEREWGIEGNQRRIDEAAQYEREHRGR